MKTKCYTFEVTMLIQILADDEKTTSLTDSPKLVK